MEFAKFVRKPFEVEAVQITHENLEELAGLIGEAKTSEDGAPYIQVNNKKIKYITEVGPGDWITRMGKQIRCYKQQVFEEQFVFNFENVAAAVDVINNPA